MNFLSDDMKKRKFLLECAFNLYMSCNYEQGTIREFEKRFGIKNGTIYNFYRSKKDLFQDMINEFIFNAQKAENKFKMVENCTLEEFFPIYTEGIEKTIEKYYHVANPIEKHTPYKNFFALLYDGARHCEDFEEKIHLLYKEEVNLWKKIIINSINKNQVRKEIRVDITAENFRAIFVGLSMQHSFIGGLQINLLKECLYEYYTLIKL